VLPWTESAAAAQQQQEGGVSSAGGCAHLVQHGVAAVDPLGGRVAHRMAAKGVIRDLEAAVSFALRV
jgi:hypothetical protein